MCRKKAQTSNLDSAAKHLINHLQIPSHCYSVSSFYVGDGVYALHLSLSKSWMHVKSKVPADWEGFQVIINIADNPTAY